MTPGALPVGVTAEESARLYAQTVQQDPDAVLREMRQRVLVGTPAERSRALDAYVSALMAAPPSDGPLPWSRDPGLEPGEFLCAGGSGQVLSVDPPDGTASPTVMVNRDICSAVVIDRREVPELIRRLAAVAELDARVLASTWRHAQAPERPHVPICAERTDPKADRALCCCGAVLVRCETGR